ncbi:hypothetical protein SORBI_3001G375400, partial [Sorghum bicolor]
ALVNSRSFSVKPTQQCSRSLSAGIVITCLVISVTTAQKQQTYSHTPILQSRKPIDIRRQIGDGRKSSGGDQGGRPPGPEVCLAHAIALTSPRDACRCAAVSPAFRAAADSDHVWRRFLPQGQDGYLRLCDTGVVLVDGQGNAWMWVDKASGAKCYVLSARALSLPWDDGEFSWRWTPHPLSSDKHARHGSASKQVNLQDGRLLASSLALSSIEQLVKFRDAVGKNNSILHVAGRLPVAELTPATVYAAYLVYGLADGHRGLSFPDQETTVALGSGRVAGAARHAVCLHPDEAEERKFRAVSRGTGAEEPRPPRLPENGWSEMEMGRLRTPGDGERETAVAGKDEEVVVVSFVVLGWYPKRGLIVEGIEFRPVY